MHTPSLVILFVVSLLASVVATSEPGVAVRVGYAQTFAVTPGTGLDFVPGKARETPIGPAAPEADEITVGLAPAGNAVRVARLHAYERTRQPIAFIAEAKNGTIHLTTEHVCGRVDTDAWIALPPETTRVTVSHFVVAGKACE